MIRRVLLLMMAAAIGFGASDFWNKKKPADWSADEIDQLKSRSPWAKKIRIDRARPESMDTEGSRGTFGGMQGADRNGISDGGGGRGARGGRGGDPDATGAATRAAMPATEVIVRWESAAPLRDATKIQLPPAFENCYAISVTGLPPAVLITGVGRGSGDQRAMVQRLLGVTTLSAKSHDPEAAAVVVQSADRASLIFAFPKQALPLTVDDKNVVFAMNLGSTAIKARFEPKEMSWNGQLGL